MNITWKVVMAALLPVSLVGCVTINIYFPEAAAEKAADRIIEDVWQPGIDTRDADASEGEAR